MKIKFKNWTLTIELILCFITLLLLGLFSIVEMKNTVGGIIFFFFSAILAYGTIDNCVTSIICFDDKFIFSTLTQKTNIKYEDYPILLVATYARKKYLICHRDRGEPVTYISTHSLLFEGEFNNKFFAIRYSEKRLEALKPHYSQILYVKINRWGGVIQK